MRHGGEVVQMFLSFRQRSCVTGNSDGLRLRRRLSIVYSARPAPHGMDQDVCVDRERVGETSDETIERMRRWREAVSLLVMRPTTIRMNRRRMGGRLLLDALEVAIITTLVFLIARVFVQNYQVDGPSMTPHLAQQPVIFW